jgi:hypothetical protein
MTLDEVIEESMAWHQWVLSPGTVGKVEEASGAVKVRKDPRIYMCV